MRTTCHHRIALGLGLVALAASLHAQEAAPTERDLFVDYIETKGGNVNALVNALGG